MLDVCCSALLPYAPPLYTPDIIHVFVDWISGLDLCISNSGGHVLSMFWHVL